MLQDLPQVRASRGPGITLIYASLALEIATIPFEPSAHPRQTLRKE